ncbi:MAG: hypothetical protein L3J12_07605, partial [Spirochaetales bacterium]|nr:hypothetical protein [Spirochaetales bacterium]
MDGLHKGLDEMTIHEFLKILDAEPLIPFDDSVEIKRAFTSNMMSEVLTLQDSDVALLTTLNNPQVIRTVEMLGLVCICFVSGKIPPEETVNLARSNNIPIVCTTLFLFEAYGRLYEVG